MAKPEKPVTKEKEEDSGEFNRAPRQKSEDRNPVESAEKTKQRLLGLQALNTAW